MSNRNHQSNSSPSPKVEEPKLPEVKVPEKKDLIQDKPEVLDSLAMLVLQCVLRGNEAQHKALIAYILGTGQAAKEPSPKPYDKDLVKLKLLLNVKGKK